MRATALPVLAAATIVTAALTAAQPEIASGPVPLVLDRLELHGVSASMARHENRVALRLIEPGPGRNGGLAILRNVTAEDAEIRIDVAGRRGPYAQPDDRGFVGLAFRVAADAARYEYFYVRPENGRADDQERRNHATQYASHPDFPWQVLRKAFPGRYESYVDLVPGAWTSLRIVVQGRTARLYVHDAAQPALIVNDLKLSPGPGQIGLWIGSGTEAFFDKLSVTHIASNLTRP